MKLMVVEDEKVIRNGLLKHVPWQKLGVWEVQAAENGEKALELAETFHPDIVLSDIRMPGMSGIELCRTLREKYPEIEIIFSTGYADKEYLKAAIDLHAVGYVEKPVNVNLLAENVKEAVKRVGERRKNERANSEIICWSWIPMFPWNRQRVRTSGLSEFISTGKAVEMAFFQCSKRN